MSVYIVMQISEIISLGKPNKNPKSTVMRACGSTVVEALCYKLEGCRFETQ
jgi:hypothetical protein